MRLCTTKDTLPAHFYQAIISKGLKDSNITISIMLPGEAVESTGETSDENGQATCKATASFDKPVRVMLHTRLLSPRRLRKAHRRAVPRP